MKIDFDLDEESVDATLAKLWEKVKDGAEEGLNDTLDAGEDTARSVLLTSRRPYTTPHLHNSFDTHQFDLGETLQGHVVNPRKHAAYIDKGVSGVERQRPDTPFSYDNKMPPIDEMIKFVKERMGGWDIDTDLDDGAIPKGGDDGSDGDEGGDDSEDSEKDFANPETERYARAFNVNDVVLDEESDTYYRIKEEDSEKGGYYISDGEEIEFIDYFEAGSEYEHSFLDGNDIDEAIPQREKYNKLIDNFGNATPWDEFNGEVKEGDVLQFELVRGDTAYGIVYPEEAQDGDGINVETFAIEPSQLDGTLVNNYDFEGGIEPLVTVNNPEKIWKKADLESKPHPEGEVSKEKLDNLSNARKASPRKYYTGEINIENIEVGDEIKIDVPNASTAKNLVVSKITEQEIIFTNGDGYNITTLEENDIELLSYTKNYTTIHQLEEGDEILIDAGDYRDLPFNEKSLVKIKSKTGDTRVTVSRRYGQKEYDIYLRSDSYHYSRQDRSGLWDLKILNDGFLDTRKRVTFELGTDQGYSSSNTIKNGILTEVENDDTYTTKGDIQVKYYNESGILKNERLNLDQIIEVKEDVSIPNKIKEHDPGLEDVSWVEQNPSGIKKNKISEDDQILAWDREAEKYVSGTASIGFRDVTGKVNERLGARFITEYDDYGNTRSDSRYVIVAKSNSDDFQNPQSVPRNKEARPKFFYGQEIEFEYENETRYGYLTDWNYRYIEIEGSDAVDKIPLKPTLEAPNNARLNDIQEWSSLSPSEKIEQIKNEWKYGKDVVYQNEEFVEEFSEKVGEELPESFRDIDDVRDITARIDKYSQYSNAGGSIKTHGDDIDGYEYTINSSNITGEYSIKHSTFHHEFEHAYLYSNGFNNGKEAIRNASSWHPNYPDVEFDEFGNAGNNVRHPDLEEHLFRKGRDQEKVTDLNNKPTFEDINLEYGYFKNFDPESLTQDELDTQFSFREVLNEAEKDDILKLEFDRLLYKVEKLVVVTEDNGNSLTVKSFSDGKEIELYDPGSAQNLLGFYQTDNEEKLDRKGRVNSNWEPESTEPIRKYAETANRSLKRRLWSANSDSTTTRDILEINRSYHTANAHESVTGMAEVFQANDYDKGKQLIEVYQNHKEFVEAYLELHYPSETVVKIIKDEPELSELESYL